MADRPIKPEVLPPERPLTPDLEAMRRVASLLDEAVRIPGTGRKVGLDAALGLIPGLGDVAGALLSAWIVIGGIRHRVPARKVGRMIANVVIDLVVGEIPVLGDIFDALFPQNVSNVRILLDHRDGSRPPRTLGEIGGLALAVASTFVVLGLAVSAAGLWLLWVLIRAIA